MITTEIRTADRGDLPYLIERVVWNGPHDTVSHRMPLAAFRTMEMRANSLPDIVAEERLWLGNEYFER